TTPERAEEDLATCVYDVHDLVVDGKSFQGLADAITSNIASESWAKNGGSAEIRPVRPGLLVIAQTPPVHEEITDLLAAIREMQPRQTVVPWAADGSRGEHVSGGEGGASPTAEPTPADSDDN